MKFLRGQATHLSCFVTYDDAFFVAIAESFFRIGLGNAHKGAPALHSGLLRTGYERPCHCHEPGQRNELAAPHSVSSSAIIKTFWGIGQMNKHVKDNAAHSLYS
jgi:hypothetical protein